MRRFAQGQSLLISGPLSRRLAKALELSASASFSSVSFDVRVTGTGDDNVHFHNMIMLYEELIEKEIQFEAMIYPNEDHGTSPLSPLPPSRLLRDDGRAAVAPRRPLESSRCVLWSASLRSRTLRAR